MENYTKSAALKRQVIETNREFEESNFPSVIKSDIDLIHKGRTIEATAFMIIKNDNDVQLDQYLFSLNPGLEVSSVLKSEKPLAFTASGHIVKVSPGKPLLPGESDTIEISWSGKILESFCYPDYSDNIKEYKYRIQMVNVKKRQVFLDKDYVLLTPEAHWYPVAGLNYYPSNPARIKIDFTTFSLKAKSGSGLNIVSQGLPSESGDYTCFSAGFPLTGLSVAMGKYVADTISVDSIKFISWHYPGNDYYRKHFEELKDTLPNLISGFMKDLESGFGTSYPFSSLSLVEVPVNFFSFSRKNTQTRAEVQPSMVLLPERLSTLQQAGFEKRFLRQKKQMARNNQVITDKELKVRIFNTFIRSTFINGQNFRMINATLVNEPTRYLLGPSFYFFRNNFYSDKYPVVNSVFESHLQKVNTPAPPGGGPMQMGGNISDNDRANLILRDISFRDLLARNPSPDTLRVVLTIKGDYLFNLLRMHAGITEFNEWFKKYLSENSFTRVNILKFNDDVKKQFGFEFYPLLEEWFTGKGQPGFLFTDLEASQVVVGERTRYNVTFIAGNPEPAGGLFNLSFRTGGGFGGRGGGQGMFSMAIQGGRGGGV
ncbi:MAG: M1 family metallopeptidase, partial [Bacteroidales bacterium]|nr:M1 family metallopeptidase [Bacteroidales bacterium]